MLALFPRWFGEGDSAVRDAAMGAAAEAWTKFASKQAAFAAGADPRYAIGSRLDLIGGAERPRADGENDEEYRARVLGDEDIATPRAILAAIDRILAPLTSKQAYYYERPDDDAFVHVKSTTVTIGTFIGGKASSSPKQPIRKTQRFYDERTRCKPRHLFLFKSRRGVTTVDEVVGSSAFVVRERATDDTTAPDNAHGHAVIGLPAFIQPGKSLSHDIAVSTKPAAPLTDASGNLTAAARQKGKVLSSVFTKASAALLLPEGIPTVYRSTSQPDIVTARIRATLAQRGMCPAKFTLMFDPSL